METEKTVYFVRHGQSEDNVAPVFQSPDSPLSKEGRQQAERIALRAATLSFDALISSPFRRAKETAEAIARVTGKEPEFSDLFIERVKPTSITGKAYEAEGASQIWKEWNKTLYAPGSRVEDGENFDDLAARSAAALEFLRKRGERSILVVTHGFFLRTIVARVLLGDMFSAEAFKGFQRASIMENTSLTALRYQRMSEGADPVWRLWIYNDHAHLG